MGIKITSEIPATQSRKPENDWVESLLKKEINLIGGYFNSKQKEAFYTELSVLLQAGVQLRESLEIMSSNEAKAKRKELLQNMVAQLVQGESFSEVMQSHGVFTEYEYYAVQIGEESGNLPKITAELAFFFTKKNEQRRSIINALTYPAIILSTAVLVVVFMLKMVVPMFKDIFRQNGVDLPAITKAIVSISEFLDAYGWLALVGFFGLFVARKTLLKNKTFKGHVDEFSLGIPFLGPYLKAIYLAQFTQSVALLSSSKVPLLNSVQMVKKMIGFTPLQDALTAMETDMIKGKSLYESFASSSFFDAKMGTLIRVAEETNQTDYIFNKLYYQYRDEVERKSKMLTTLLEPIIIVFVGLFVGVILVAMYLPMFQLSSVLG